MATIRNPEVHAARRVALPPTRPSKTLGVSQSRTLESNDRGTIKALPTMLSVAQAAKVLGVSDDLVYELTARGELPSLRLGRRRVIPRRAIELVIEEAISGFDAGTLQSHLLGESGISPTSEGISNGPSVAKEVYIAPS